jgi:uncharacterized protein YutE (UPF0331/DUF86 family)
MRQPGAGGVHRPRGRLRDELDPPGRDGAEPDPACEQAIDMANRATYLHKLEIADDTAETFVVLAKAGLIPPDLAQSMKRMVGFRNVAVHEYQELDVQKVRHIIEHRLDDLLAFSKAMLRADPSG